MTLANLLTPAFEKSTYGTMYPAVCYNTAVLLTRKLSYRKDDRAMRPMYGRPENFQESLTTHTAILFPNF